MKRRLVFPTPTVTEQFVEHPVNLKPVYFTPSPTATPVSTIYIPHEATTLHIAQPGSLAVTSTPSGAEVWVNGVDTGQTTLAMLAEDPGSYQVLVKLDCYGVPDTQTVTVYPGQETNATFSLTRLDTCPIKPVVISTCTVCRIINSPVSLSAKTAKKRITILFFNF